MFCEYDETGKLIVSNGNTLLIKNSDHHIPIQASSTALNYILKKL